MCNVYMYVSNGEYVDPFHWFYIASSVSEVQKNANESMHWVYAIGQPL